MLHPLAGATRQYALLKRPAEAKRPYGGYGKPIRDLKERSTVLQSNAAQCSSSSRTQHSAAAQDSVFNEEHVPGSFSETEHLPDSDEENMDTGGGGSEDDAEPGGGGGVCSGPDADTIKWLSARICDYDHSKDEWIFQLDECDRNESCAGCDQCRFTIKSDDIVAW